METTTAAQRLELGTQRIADLFNFWFARSPGVGHRPFAAIIHWAINEATGFDSGILSRIRNNRQPRGAGLQHLDAFAAANRAIWMWQTQGEQAAIREYGPFSSWGVVPEWLSDAAWLPKPDDETQPLDLGDFANIQLGRLELPYLSGQMSAGQAKRANDRLAELLDDLAADNGWGPREAVQQFIQAYPPTDHARQYRLKELLMGEAFTQAELEMELAALAEMIRHVRGLKTYSPGDLQAELLSDRRLRS
jgi:hypothetical protein